MRAQNEAVAIGVTRAVVGLSAAVQVAAIANQAWIEIGLMSAGGTLYVSGTTNGWASGRPFAGTNTNDHLQIWGAPTNVYLLAVGATMTAHITYYLTSSP